MDFDPAKYGQDVARILSMDGNGERLMPLECGNCSNPEVHQILKTMRPGNLFPESADPRTAMAGLWLYFSCFEEAHELAQDCESTEGSLWHAILHRQEPDSGNSAYWFRRAGEHPTFSAISAEASKILKRYPDAEFRVGKWDPFGFIQFCERARMQPGTVQETAAQEIQRVEWQILFDYCARQSK